MPAFTSTGEPILDGLPICIPKLLMPRKDIDLSKWACVACDQFESEPHYWAEMDKHAGSAPSSLRIVFPEVYLASVTGSSPDEDKKRIDVICKTMRSYIDQGVFDERPPAFMAIDRRTQCVPSRKGLIVAVDLEQYNFNCPLPTLIRPTEKTIVARLPPRIAIRENAPVELPHIIMIIDDAEKSVIEPLFEQPGLSEADYEVELFKGAGAVQGFRVTPSGTLHVQKSMKALVEKETKAASEAGRQPAVILIGDGNHSLATAKACWEALKKKDGIGMDHPQRFALVELQNLHDDGVVFEPIHRILVGADASELESFLTSTWGCASKKYSEPVPAQAIVLVTDDSNRILLEPPTDTLPVVSMSVAVDAFVENHPSVKIGYVHGEEPVFAACKGRKAVGLILPALDKTRFLSTLHSIGTLPRKAFSMGEANEKRFYVEARNILPKSLSNEQQMLINSFRCHDFNCTGRVNESVLRSVFTRFLPNVLDDDFRRLVDSSGSEIGDLIDYERFTKFLV